MNHIPIADDAAQEDIRECALRENLIDIRLIDWNRVWQAQRARRSLSKRDSSFWDGRAVSFAKAASETSYADQFLAIMKPEARWTVLDMGCGSGTLAVPLAKLVSSVIAVDFSGRMLDVVRKRCADEDIRNITTIHGRWEDEWEKLGIGTCDAAIASRSMVTDDLQASIQKLNAIARKSVYIATVVGDGPHDRHIFDAVGKTFIPGPDYIYLYNMLYQMGISANVAFIEEKRKRTFKSLEEAVESMNWMFDELNSREEERLKAYLDKHLVFHNGCGSLSYDKVIRWALLWWKK